MADIPDLGAMQSAANGQYDEPEAPEATKAVTAFLVVCLPDGRKVAYSDVNTPLELEREATLNDMYDGAAQVQRDVNMMLITSQVVNNTISGLMQIMSQQMKAVSDQQLAAQVLNRTQRRH